MISAKYYSNWLREAGSGHIAAILSWGSFLLYLVFKLMELSADTEYNFFGIGSSELCFLSAALGLALAFEEFFYLFQMKKQDFYYSLPVKKGTIFWSRYMHGLVQFVIPFLSVQVICALFEMSRDSRFAAHAWAYMIRSVGIFLLIFCMFYHMGMLAIVVSGKIFTAVFVSMMLLFYGQILVQNIFFSFAEQIYCSFYRIPFLEEAGILIVPLKLAGELAGTKLFEKREILEYVPEGRYVLTAVVCAVLCLIGAALIQKKRKSEMTGRVFTSIAAERVTEVMVSFLVGLFSGSFIIKVLGITPKGMAVTGVVLCVCVVTGALFTHILAEWLIQMPRKRLLRRRAQMALEVISVCAVVLLLVNSRSSFDRFLPGDSEIESLSVCMKGLDMEESRFEQNGEENNYLIEERLKRYTMTDDGMKAGMEWLRQLQDRLDGSKDMFDNIVDPNGETESGRLTTVTVCYQLKSGVKKYRAYPVDEKALEEFAGIYETDEYKNLTYPLMDAVSLAQERITWSDGVTDAVIKLSEKEKEDLLEAYKADVSGMEMEDLKTSLPVGYVQIESQVSGTYTEAVIYPFFERTCTFLGNHGINTGKKVADYQIIEIKMQEKSERMTGIAGSSRTWFYDEKEEIEQWSGKIIPKELAIQPLLFPVDTSIQAEAEVQDESTNSTVLVYCYGLAGTGLLQ